jgi:flagellar L-ring protein precursor FlgH
MSLVACALCAGCASVSETSAPGPDYSSVRPLPDAEPVALPGTIYRAGSGGELFMDLRARAVGDILTIDLVEQTTASKESSTSTARGSNVDTGFPIFAGRPITSSGTDILNAEFGSTNTFDGAADASQSNSLDGSITVTVAERLANGNLLVRGEKWITLNQGEEFIQVQGIIRPVDIGPDNTVPSTKVADARITYSGKGNLANSNKPGWLQRFFNTPWFPF